MRFVYLPHTSLWDIPISVPSTSCHFFGFWQYRYRHLPLKLVRTVFGRTVLCDNWGGKSNLFLRSAVLFAEYQSRGLEFHEPLQIKGWLHATGRPHLIFQDSNEAT